MAYTPEQIEDALSIADTWNVPNVTRPDRSRVFDDNHALLVLAAEVRRLREELAGARKVIVEQANLRITAEQGIAHMADLKNAVHKNYSADLAARDADLFAARQALLTEGMAKNAAEAKLANLEGCLSEAGGRAGFWGALASKLNTKRKEAEARVAALRESEDMAESIICNALPMSHCSQAEWEIIVRKWRDAKHAARKEGGR